MKTYEDLSPQQQSDYNDAKSLAIRANDMHNNALQTARAIPTAIDAYEASNESSVTRKDLRTLEDVYTIQKQRYEFLSSVAADLMPPRSVFENKTPPSTSETL